MVVGIGNSGGDAAVELSRIAKQVLLEMFLIKNYNSILGKSVIIHGFTTYFQLFGELHWSNT